MRAAGVNNCAVLVPVLRAVDPHVNFLPRFSLIGSLVAFDVTLCNQLITWAEGSCTSRVVLTGDTEVVARALSGSKHVDCRRFPVSQKCTKQVNVTSNFVSCIRIEPCGREGSTHALLAKVQIQM